MARVTHLMMITATRGPQCSIRHKPSAAILRLLICLEHLSLSHLIIVMCFNYSRYSHILYICLMFIFSLSTTLRIMSFTTLDDDLSFSSRIHNTRILILCYVFSARLCFLFILLMVMLHQLFLISLLFGLDLFIAIDIDTLLLNEWVGVLG